MKGCSAILAWTSNWSIKIGKIKIWQCKKSIKMQYDIMSVSEREEVLLVHREYNRKQMIRH